MLLLPPRHILRFFRIYIYIYARTFSFNWINYDGSSVRRDRIAITATRDDWISWSWIGYNDRPLIEFIPIRKRAIIFSKLDDVQQRVIRKIHYG